MVGRVSRPASLLYSLSHSLTLIPSSPIGHFTAMAQQANTAVGCAVASYVSNSLNNFLLACNYATTNIVGEPVYRRGITAAGCNTGTNVNYNGLCKVAEVYA